MYFYTLYNKHFFVRIKLHCPCVSKDYANYQISVISRKPCHLSRAIFSPQDTHRNQPHDAACSLLVECSGNRISAIVFEQIRYGTSTLHFNDLKHLGGVQSFSKMVLYLLTRIESPILNFADPAIFTRLYIVVKSLSVIAGVTSTGRMPIFRCAL